MKVATSSYTWGKLRNPADVARMLDEVIEAGLRNLAVQPVDLLPAELMSDPTPFIDLAREKGIEIMALAGDSRDLGPKVAQEYGVKLMWIVIEKDSLEDWVRESIALAKQVLDLGVEVAIHPHLNSPVDTRETILEMFSRLRDSNLPNLSLCLDPGHMVGAPVNVIDVIEDFKDNIGMVHVTDYVPPPPGKPIVFEETFVDLGEGTVDYRPILNHLNKIGYDGWYVIEAHYPMGKSTPMETVRLNRVRFEEMVSTLA